MLSQFVIFCWVGVIYILWVTNLKPREICLLHTAHKLTANALFYKSRKKKRIHYFSLHLGFINTLLIYHWYIPDWLTIGKTCWLQLNIFSASKNKIYSYILLIKLKWAWQFLVWMKYNIFFKECTFVPNVFLRADAHDDRSSIWRKWFISTLQSYVCMNISSIRIWPTVSSMRVLCCFFRNRVVVSFNQQNFHSVLLWSIENISNMLG